MRVPQSKASKGSQFWFQKLVNEHASLLNGRVMAAAERPLPDYFEFVSPLADDDYAEYRDDDAVKRLCKHGVVKESVKTFWPRGGPQWDGLAYSQSNNVFLF